MLAGPVGGAYTGPVPVSPADAAATLQQRAAAERARVEARANAIRARLPEAVAMLRARYGVTDAWLFGSLATGRAHAGSDADLAVSVRVEKYFEALAELVEILDCDVDLVELPAASPSMRARVRREGVPL